MFEIGSEVRVEKLDDDRHSPFFWFFEGATDDVLFALRFRCSPPELLEL